jgi:hypothetical protein
VESATRDCGREGCESTPTLSPAAKSWAGCDVCTGWSCVEVSGDYEGDERGGGAAEDGRDS